MDHASEAKLGEGTRPVVTPNAARGKPASRGAARDLSPGTIARTLRAVADELERDPSLARRVAEAAGETGEPRKEDGERFTKRTRRTQRDGEGSRETSPPTPLPRGEGSRGEDRDGEWRGRARSQESGGRRFRPRLVPGTPPELGTGIPDPFALAERLGAAGLRAALDDLRLGTLRAIVREHGLDPAGHASRQNDAERLRAVILAAVGVR